MSASLPASTGASASGDKTAPAQGARYPKSRRIRKRKDFLRVQERPDAPAGRPAVDSAGRPAIDPAGRPAVAPAGRPAIDPERRPAVDSKRQPSSTPKARDRASGADRPVTTPDLDSAPPRASARVTTAHFVLLLAPQRAAPTALNASQTRPPANDGASPLPPCRLGIVASKKIGVAVIRNRAKRLLREAFRLRNSLFPAGIDLVVIARPGAADLSLGAVIREMEGIASILGRRAHQVLQK